MIFFTGLRANNFQQLLPKIFAAMSNKLTHVKKKKVQEQTRSEVDGKKVLLIIFAVTLVLILILFAISS